MSHLTEPQGVCPSGPTPNETGSAAPGCVSGSLSVFVLTGWCVRQSDTSHRLLSTHAHTHTHTHTRQPELKRSETEQNPELSSSWKHTCNLTSPSGSARLSKPPPHMLMSHFTVTQNHPGTEPICSGLAQNKFWVKQCDGLSLCLIQVPARSLLTD